jgi:hypothetical protein
LVTYVTGFAAVLKKLASDEEEEAGVLEHGEDPTGGFMSPQAIERMTAHLSPAERDRFMAHVAEGAAHMQQFKRAEEAERKSRRTGLWVALVVVVVVGAGLLFVWMGAC